jgi:hypothetical protein
VVHDARGDFVRPSRYGTCTMKQFRFAYVAPLAMFAALATGCATGSDTAREAETTQPAVVGDDIELDGVRFDVRRDPG